MTTKAKKSELQPLVDKINSYLTDCKIYNGKCANCKGNIKGKRLAGGNRIYHCRYAFKVIKEFKKPQNKEFITEEDLATLRVHAVSYNGLESISVFENIIAKLSE